jgi:predicted peroxiredoxin
LVLRLASAVPLQQVTAIQLERSSVAWSIANGGIGMGFEVTMFLVSSGVDWVRKGAAAGAQLNPFDPNMG